MPKPITGLIAYVVVRKRLVNIKLDSNDTVPLELQNR